MSKSFNVGDRVKTIGDAGNATIPVDSLGTVKYVDASSILVEFDEASVQGHDGNSSVHLLASKRGWWCSRQILETLQNITTDSPFDTAEENLRTQFPYGHPLYIPIVVRQVALHSNKNHDYARGGDPLGNFRRVSNILKQWPNFPYNTPEGVAFIYALKQLDAEAWTMCQGGECKVEGLEGRTDDQAIYANIRRCIRATDPPLVNGEPPKQEEGDR
jgi:hypothetical protein